MRLINRWIATPCKRLNELFNHPIKSEKDFLWEQDFENYLYNFSFIKYDDFVRLLVVNNIKPDEFGVILSNQIIKYLIKSFDSKSFVNAIYSYPNNKTVARLVLEIRKYKLVQEL